MNDLVSFGIETGDELFAAETGLFGGPIARSGLPPLPGSLASGGPGSGLEPIAVESVWAQAIIGTDLEQNFSRASQIGDPITGALTNNLTFGGSELIGGYIETDSSGEIDVEYLFDSGQLSEMRVGVFSLDGMDAYSPNWNAFQQEAARRIQSNSVLGVEIVNDNTDAAKFDSPLPWVAAYNTGQYQGIQTFQLMPDAQYGLFILRRDSWSDVIANPGRSAWWLSLELDGSPNLFDSKQIADVTGDGTLLGIEDIRLAWGGDRSYDDIVFQIIGADFVGHLGDELIDPNSEWRNEPLGQEIIDYALAQIGDEDPPVIQAALANDTGTSSSDGLTNDATIAGTVTDESAVASLRAGFSNAAVEDYVEIIDSVDSEGNFDLDQSLLAAIMGEPLADGQHTLNLIASDEIGNLSTIQVDFVLDTEATSVLTGIDLLATSDSGRSDSDNITNDNTPTLAGTIDQVEPESQVLIYRAEELIAQTEASSSWQVTANQLSDGQQTLEVKVIDKAGNESEALTLEIIIDTLSPEIDLSSPTDGGTVTWKTPLAGRIDGTGSQANALSYQFDSLGEIPIPFVGPTGQFNEIFNLEQVAEGFHTLSIYSEDLAGNTTTTQLGVTVDPTVPFEIADHKPLDGGIDVGVTFKPQIFFSKPVNPDSLNSDNFFASFGGNKLSAKIVPAEGGEFAWLFFDEPLPDASSIRVTVDGDSIMSVEGNEALDADGDGTPGGAKNFDFSTVSLATLPNTVLSGIVADPGPDLKPYTSDDVDPGADGEFHTADDTFLLPIEGVKVFAIGLEDEAIFTGADGRFRFDAMPSGNVKLVVDGLSAINAPAGSYFPEMVMDVNISPGVENTVMFGMPEIFLPRLNEAILQQLDMNNTTRIVADEISAPELSPEQRQFLSIDVQPNSLLDATGEKLDSGTVGISTVPPELVRDMLPAGLLQHTFDITVQAPGISNFSTPAPMTFPNLFDAAPGTQLDFLSFDHTTGRLVIEGTATVSQDGQFASTDPGTGITHPGWHGLTPPGVLMRVKQAPPCPSESHKPDTGNTTTVLPPEGVLLVGEDEKFEIPTFEVPSESQAIVEPTTNSNCPHSEVSRLEVDIKIEGPLQDFVEKAGTLPVKNQFFDLNVGDNEKFAVKLKPYNEIDNLPDFAELDADHLFGSKIKVSETSFRSDGSTHTEEKTYYLYRWLDVIAGSAEEEPSNSKAAFHRTLADGKGNFVRSKEVELHLPESFSTSFVGINNADFEYLGSFQGRDTAEWLFDPSNEGSKADLIQVQVNDSEIQEPLPLTFRNILATGTATEPTTISLNLEVFKNIFKNVLTGIQEVGIENGETKYGYNVPLVAAENQPPPVSANFANTFKEFFGANSDSPEAVAAIETEANNLFAEVQADFLQANTGGIEAYQLFENNSNADVQADWKTLLFQPSGVFSPETAGSTRIDRNNDFLKRVLGNSEIGDASKKWALAEGLNQNKQGELDVYLVVNAIIYGGVKKEDSEDNGFKKFESFGEQLADVVSQELGHTFGLNEMYVLEGNLGRDVEKADLMGSLDGMKDKEFSPHNLETLRAALGFHETPTKNNTSLDDAVKNYWRDFFLPEYQQFPQEVTSVLEHPKYRDLPHLRIRTSEGNDVSHDSRVPLTFETVPVDGSGGALSTLELVVRNEGGPDPLVISSIELEKGNSGFSIVGGTEVIGQPLASGESGTITLRFDPAKAEVLEDVLIVDSNGYGDAPFRINLKGEAFPQSPTAGLEVAKNNNLGGVPVAEGSAEKDRIATISNSGAEALVISNIELAEGIGRFDLLGLPADLASNPIVLNTAEEFSFGVRFNPDYVGLDRALIDIVTNDPARPILRLSAVGTGVDEVVYPQWGKDFVAVHNSDLPGAEILRTVSDDGGNFEFFIAPEEFYEVWIFDPDTGLISERGGFTPVAGREFDPTSGMLFRASDVPDRDFDGLPDNIETAIGTNLDNPDTDGDGIDDFSAIQQKIDPLGEAVLPIGVVSAIQPPNNGNVTDVVANDKTAYIASGPGGVQAVNLERITKPIVTGSIPASDLGGDALAVAFTSIQGASADTFVNVVAAAVGNGGLAIIDVTEPEAAKVLHQVSLEGSSEKVEIVDTFAYVGKSDGQIDVVNLRTGTLVHNFTAEGFGGLSEVRASGGTLYTLRGSTLAAYDLMGNFAAPPLLSSLAQLPATNLFVGSDRAYLSGNGSLTAVDISDPTDLRVTSSDSPTLLYRGVAANGSGRLLVGTSNDPRNFDIKLSLFNIEDPDNTNSFIAQLDTSGDVQDIWIQNGLALVADGSGGLAVVNYMQPDPGETPPTIAVSTSSADGTTVVEGQRLRVDVNTLDDVQTSQVRVVANGVDLQADGSFPFTFFVDVPTLSDGTSSLILEVIATDTGGNESTEQVEFSIVEDRIGPELLQVVSVYQETPSQAIDSFQVSFNEPLAADSINGNSVRIVKLENGSEVEQTIGELSFEPILNLLTVRPAAPLGAGDYELHLNRELLTDRAGNAWGTGLFKTGIYQTGARPEFIAIGDLNNDDRLDIVTANLDSDSLSILLGNGDGTVQAARDLPVGLQPKSVALADLDSDGDEDILVALVGESAIAEFLGDGTGNFLPGDSYSVANQPNQIALGDVDGDGIDDLVTTYKLGGTVSVLSGNSDGSFDARVDIDLELQGLTSVSLADLDADSDEELILSGYGYGVDRITVIGNSGAALSDIPDTYSLGNFAGIKDFALGDLDGDGDLDLVSANADTNNSSVLLNNGDGSFAPKTDYPTGTRPVSVALGDLDNDNNLDAATANASGSVSVLLGTGNGALGSAEDLPLGDSPSDIALGDFDGDGNLDVAVADAQGDRLYLVGNWFTAGA